MTKEIPDILDLGCGARKLHGSYGVDLINLPEVDLVHDLNQLPWPLPSSHFRWVRGIDVMEHVNDFIGCIAEIHRVLIPGGRLTIKMPFAGSVHHHTDPTHRRSATSRTLDYFTADSHFSKYHYTAPLFRLEEFRYVREVPVSPPIGTLIRALDKIVIPWAQLFHDLYEHYFVGFYPMHSIIFECTRR